MSGCWGTVLVELFVRSLSEDIVPFWWNENSAHWAATFSQLLTHTTVNKKWHLYAILEIRIKVLDGRHFLLIDRDNVGMQIKCGGVWTNLPWWEEQEMKVYSQKWAAGVLACSWISNHSITFCNSFTNKTPRKGEASELKLQVGVTDMGLWPGLPSAHLFSFQIGMWGSQ